MSSDKSKQNKKQGEMSNKTISILYAISAALFIFTGISSIVERGFSHWAGVTDIALAITFGALAFMYYKKYKDEK